MTMNLPKLLDNLKHNPSVKYANRVMFNLAGDGGYYYPIRDYQQGRFAPQDIAVDSIRNLTYNEGPRDAKLDSANANHVAKYADTDWIDFDTLKPVTAADVRDVIMNALM